VFSSFPRLADTCGAKAGIHFIRLRLWRKHAPISCILAVLAGVSGLTVNAFEQQKTSITLDSALKTFRCLGMS